MSKLSFFVILCFFVLSNSTLLKVDYINGIDEPNCFEKNNTCKTLEYTFKNLDDKQDYEIQLVGEFIELKELIEYKNKKNGLKLFSNELTEVRIKSSFNSILIDVEGKASVEGIIFEGPLSGTPGELSGKTILSVQGEDANINNCQFNHFENGGKIAAPIMTNSILNHINCRNQTFSFLDIPKIENSRMQNMEKCILFHQYHLEIKKTTFTNELALELKGTVSIIDSDFDTIQPIIHDDIIAMKEGDITISKSRFKNIDTFDVFFNVLGSLHLTGNTFENVDKIHYFFDCNKGQIFITDDNIIDPWMNDFKCGNCTVNEDTCLNFWNHHAPPILNWLYWVIPVSVLSAILVVIIILSFSLDTIRLITRKVLKTKEKAGYQKIDV